MAHFLCQASGVTNMQTEDDDAGTNREPVEMRSDPEREPEPVSESDDRTLEETGYGYGV
jgi:hypothetical protein